MPSTILNPVEVISTNADGSRNIRFKTGDLGNGYARKNNGQMIRNDAKPTPKKHRNKCRRARELHPVGHSFICAPGCGNYTYAYKTVWMDKKSGAAADIYQCSICGVQFAAKSVDDFFASIEASKNPVAQS